MCVNFGRRNEGGAHRSTDDHTLGERGNQIVFPLLTFLAMRLLFVRSRFDFYCLLPASQKP